MFNLMNTDVKSVGILLLNILEYSAAFSTLLYI